MLELLVAASLLATALVFVTLRRPGWAELDHREEPDLPCPWCFSRTREDDRACPSCGELFGVDADPKHAV